jgi:hypothetical protein
MDSFPCVSEARVPGSIPGGSTVSRISLEWEAVCKTVAAGSTPERGSFLGAVLTLWQGQEQPGDLVARLVVREGQASAGTHLQIAQDDGVDCEGISFGHGRGERQVGEGAAQGGLEYCPVHSVS